jgi:membrane-associated phospholipid phosphatase
MSHQVDKSELENALGPEWYRCCWYIYTPEWLTAIGIAFATYFDPMLLTSLLESAIFINFAVHPLGFDQLDSFLSRLHNLLIIPMCGICGLYLTFKQSRPGRIKTSDGYRPMGSIYGMPSGDAMFASMVASSLFFDYPVFAVLLAISIAASRVVRGYHTIFQVTVGVALGPLFIFLANRYQIESQAVFWVACLILPTLMFVDHGVMNDVNLGGPNDLRSWFLFGSGTVFFDIVACAPQELDFAGRLAGRGVRMAVVFVVRVFVHAAVVWMGSRKVRPE